MALSKATAKEITLSKTKISATIQFKTSGNGLKSTVQWTHPNKEKITQKLQDHIQSGIYHYFDPKENKVIPIEESSIISTISTQENIQIPIGVGIFLALNTDYNIDLPKDLQAIVQTLKKQSTIKIDNKIDDILRPFQKKAFNGY